MVLKRQKGRFERWIVHFQHWILTKGLVENKTRSDKERGRQHLSTCKHVHFQADLGKSHAAGCAAHPIHRFAFLLLLLLPTPLLLLQRVYTRTRAELCDYKTQERSYSSSSSSSARSAPGPIKPRITRAVKLLSTARRRAREGRACRARTLAFSVFVRVGRTFLTHLSRRRVTDKPGGTHTGEGSHAVVTE